MKVVDKCNKVDFREYIYGVTMASPKLLKARFGKVTLVGKIKVKISTEVKTWAGKLSTR